MLSREYKAKYRHFIKGRQAIEESEKYPICDMCEKPIKKGSLFLINDSFICPECLILNFRKNASDYIE